MHNRTRRIALLTCAILAAAVASGSAAPTSAPVSDPYAALLGPG